MNIILIIAGLLAGIVVYAYFQMRKIRRRPDVPQSAKVITLTGSNFQHQINSGITLVDFWAAWCMPCKMLAPVLNEVAESVNEKARVAKVNIEEHQQLASKYKVRSIPTMILFRNGKEIDRIVGVKSKDYLISKIERAKIL